MKIKQKLEGLLNIIDEERKPLAESIITELSFIIDTLQTLRDSINETGPIELYYNGKQRILRQSPAFKGYYTLIPKYNALIKELIELMPKSSVESEPTDLEKFLKEFDQEFNSENS